MVASTELQYNKQYVINAPQKGNEDFHGERVTARAGQHRMTGWMYLHFHATGTGDYFTHTELKGMDFVFSPRIDDEDDLYA